MPNGMKQTSHIIQLEMADTSKISKNQSMHFSHCCHKAGIKKLFETPMQAPEDGWMISIHELQPIHRRIE